MKIRNDSTAKITDQEIKDIVNSNARINLINKTSEIIVSSDCHVILVVVGGTDEPEPEFVNIGKLNKKMRWGLDDD